MEISKFKNSTLVPIDFTKNSQYAMEHAGAIANLVEHQNHSITLLYVLEGVDLENPFAEGDPLPSNSNLSLMIEGAEARIKRVIKDTFGGNNTKVNYLIAGGKVYKEIADIASKISADAIVMGTHGADGGFQNFLGSNAARVIQISPCPTIIVREKHIDRGYKNIILPLDLTKETKQKVNWAIKVAQYFKSTIHIVTLSEEDEFLKKRINANMSQVEKIISEYEIPTTTTYLTETQGGFAETTINFAQEKSGDLLIIMTQQERTLSEYLFGSYAQQIVTKSTIPVMTINPRADLEGKFYY